LNISVFNMGNHRLKTFIPGE
jgi:hypothetical protein